MTATQKTSIKLGNRSSDRRLGQRDRQILDGIMKYRGEFMPVEILNLSDKGAFVVAPTVPALADAVTLTVDLPQLGMGVMVTGRVRRVTMGSRIFDCEGGFGVEFVRFYSPVGPSSLREHSLH